MTAAPSTEAAVAIGDFLGELLPVTRFGEAAAKYSTLHYITYMRTYIRLVVLRLRSKLDIRCISVSIQSN